LIVTSKTACHTFLLGSIPVRAPAFWPQSNRRASLCPSEFLRLVCKKPKHRRNRTVNRGLSDRRTRRPGTLSQCRCDRELCRRCATAAAIRKKTFLLGQPDNPVGQRSPAQGALDGGSQRRAMQSVAAPVLRTSSSRGQTRQGCGDRSNAQAADRRLERGHPSKTLRAAFAGGACPTRRGDEQGLMNSTLSSAANATT
jgi:hypothetical protein